MLLDFKHSEFNNDYKLFKRSDLGEKLARLQRQCQYFKIPVLIFIDGWESSGKGYVIKDLTRELDPKYFEVSIFDNPTDEEKARVFSWRFWNKLPKKGHFGIFDRSLYYRILSDIDVKESELEDRISEIKNMEETLYDDNAIIIKFFLHVDKETQREQIEEYENDEYREFLVSEEDYRQNKNYDIYLKHFSNILEATSSYEVPWQIVSAESKKDASRFILGKAIDEIQKGIDKHIASLENSSRIIRNYDKSPKYLESLALDKTISHEEYDAELEKLQKRAADLDYKLYTEGVPVVLAFEGMDAAGKGGGIERLTRYMDPRGYKVSTTSAPTEYENQYHYLWRFYRDFPKKGRMTIYDRSWYGRVMVERIEGFATVSEWDRAYDEINDMEKELSNFGTFILKYFLFIDKDEQMERFKAREKDKVYKITDEDWRNREKWDKYLEAMNEMIDRTNTDYAPWILVEGNDKKYARIKILKTYIENVEEFIKGNNIK